MGLQTDYAQEDTKEIMGIVSICVYGCVLGIIVSFIVWLFSIQWFREIRFILRAIPWFSPATLFVVIICAAIWCMYMFLILSY